MASSRWSSLPTDILSTISKILNTDVDILRLRSICSSWRSSVPPRLRPSFFPIKLPPLDANSYSGEGDYYLNYTTIYCLSLPEYGPRVGDPSDGWLFRVSEVNPNRFALMSLLVPVRANCAPGSPIPKLLNLLHYRITEISRCYSFTFVDSEGFVTDHEAAKVCVLSDGCDFVVFALVSGGYAGCWKYGEEDWIYMGRDFFDLVVSDGKCYAINREGMLVCYGSDLKPVETHVAPIPRCYLHHTMDLLEYKSDLYVIMKGYHFSITSQIDGNPFPFSLEIFKKCKNDWEYVKCLPDEAIISCQDASIVLQVEDFRSFKGNCVHVTLRRSLACPHSGERVTYYGVNDFAEPETATLKPFRESQLMLWPPPSWLLSE